MKFLCDDLNARNFVRKNVLCFEVKKLRIG